MSLRVRAVLIAGLSLIALWLVSAGWIIRDVRDRVDASLDQRLEMSARMASGLMLRSSLTPRTFSKDWVDAIRVGGGNGIACEIRSLDGELLALTDPHLGGELKDLPLGASTQSVDGEQWRVYTLREGGYQITTADRMDQRLAISREVLVGAGIPFLIALFGALAALWFGIGQALRPLHSLSSHLQSRLPDDSSPVPDSRVPPELRPVVHALNGLIFRLSKALSDQRAFTDAAAHELRTPLTAVVTHLQLAEDKSTDSAASSIARAKLGAARLHRTLDQLMNLARAEAVAIPIDPCISVAGVVSEVVGRFCDEQYHRIRISLPDDDRSTDVSAALLDTALRNLLDNALRYSPAESMVDVRLSFSDDSVIEVSILDKGPGISEDQAAQLGRRFWRGDMGRDATQGAGLGVSIVHAICRRFGGRLQYSAVPGGGLKATLTFRSVEIDHPQEFTKASL
ncbi:MULTISPECIES: ATP-binding protein [Stenotrophomonas]|uniref:histidine kinase n=1 Tax=Stenotrophomonas lactitubi TaxID=2045214 RepID=A0AAW4GHQ0_9GAMM|nr:MULTISPECIES: ATP-binding protein [Stenotrophomonas]MBM9914546.1 two-component sensor histidine kinase [Stenotrophomonas lactitubi]MBM9922833.1 two-component sensor histidine kinase [Stenotrophomonas lactitubi]MBM9938675.1 two-component sensor histidine kinase [Stenotrophomonas lactitubi]